MLWSDMGLVINFTQLFDIDFFLKTNHDFRRWKRHLFDILFFAHLKKMILKNLIELPINTTLDLKFHAQLEMNGI